jgi:CBS domain-containing protein
VRGPLFIRPAGFKVRTPGAPEFGYDYGKHRGVQARGAISGLRMQAPEGQAMQVKDILKIKGGQIFSIGPDALLPQAVSLMVEHDIGSLVVMEKGQMIGLLTFREVLAAVHRYRGDILEVKVNQVMVSNPICGNLDDSVDTMRSVMTDNHVRYLPIKDNTALIGVLSFHDVAKASLRAASFENKLLKQYIKNWPEQDKA